MSYEKWTRNRNLSTNEEIFLKHDVPRLATQISCRVFTKNVRKEHLEGGEKSRVEKFRWTEDDGVDRDLTKFFVPVQYRAINRR